MKNAEERIKLVVYKEHTLGYIDPKLPNNVNILHTSPLKGSPRITSDDSFCINNENEVRLAGKKDFDDFRVSFNGYDNKDLYVFLSEENIDIIFLSAISKAGSEGINACFYMDRVALDSILIRYDLEGIENKMGELATICRSGSDDEIYKANKEYEILEDKLKIKAANALEQLNIKTSFKDLQHLSGTTNENEIIGKISYYGFDGNVSEVMEYTDKESYLNAIRKEMRENPDGLKHQTLTSDPEVRKAVDDLIYGAYGVDNPYEIGWYQSSVDDNTKKRIDDINIFSLKTGGIAINCKIDGVAQHAVKMSREDINNFNEKTDRHSLICKYFRDTLKKDPSQVRREGVRNVKKFTAPEIKNYNKPKHKM